MSDYNQWLDQELKEIRQLAKDEGNDYLLGRMDEAQLASDFPDEENLTLEEFAEKLGLQRKEDGQYDIIELLNASLRAQSNPLVQALPEQERLQVISTAMAFLSR